MVRQSSPEVVRVRIAPSPTGIPHIGNTRTALFNFLFARHHRGRFILRIEDTDRARIISGAKEAIFEILHWLEFIPDETYIQSERLNFYQKAAENLLKSGFARREDRAVRFIVPKEKTIEWQDAVGNKKISFKSGAIEDFIILKSDGFPTYHLASVVDDHLMKITHVIRGDEWISSTPKHLLLYQAFGWQPPIFAHLPVILGPNRSKLSKRHGAKSVLEYREEGYLPEALNNFMALLGWNPGGDREIMSLGEMIKLFDLKDVNTAGPVFDIGKLKWMNGVYIRQLSIGDLKSKIPGLAKRSGAGKNQKSKLQLKIQKLDKAVFNKLVSLAQTRMTTLNDFEEFVRPILEEPQIELTKYDREIVKALLKELATIQQWNNQAILQILRSVIMRYNVRMPTLYKIFTGKESGLPLPEVLEILGKEETIKRLKKMV